MAALGRNVRCPSTGGATDKMSVVPVRSEIRRLMEDERGRVRARQRQREVVAALGIGRAADRHLLRQA